MFDFWVETLVSRFGPSQQGGSGDGSIKNSLKLALSACGNFQNAYHKGTS
jgi:hypothetical protein